MASDRLEARRRSTTAHLDVAGGAVLSSVGVLGVGYRIDDAPYALTLRCSDGCLRDVVERVAVVHAMALGYSSTRFELRPSPTGEGCARLLARFALAVNALAEGRSLRGDEWRSLIDVHDRARSLVGSAQHGERMAVIHADGSYDAGDELLSVGYTLNGCPYAVSFRAEGLVGGSVAEREAIRVALEHARLLGFEEFEVRSDHLFHVRRYAENLVHRGRRKSASLERLDALVDALGGRVRFQYTPTFALDAPHRMAVHARALARLARGLPLSRPQRSALRRVHFALRSAGPVPF